MSKLQGGPILVNRPRKVICRVGDYSISVSSDNQLEDDAKFNAFCDEFRMVLVAMTRAAENKKAQPTVAHEGIS